jgi:hypothetical protein
MKALEKDRDRRYETANGLGADVRRYLDDEPVQACPPSAWDRFRKFASRNRKGLATTGLATGSGLIVVSVLGAWQFQHASRVRQLSQDMRPALAGARTTVEAGDLALVARRVAEAHGRLGGDRASLPELAGDADALARDSGTAGRRDPLPAFSQIGQRRPGPPEPRRFPTESRTRQRGGARASRHPDGYGVVVSARLLPSDCGSEKTGPGGSLYHTRCPGQLPRSGVWPA